MLQRWFLAASAALVFLSSTSQVEASILGTNVATSMSIRQNDPLVEVSDTNTGLTSALVDVLGPANSRAMADLNLSSLGTETATLDFSILMDAGDIATGYIGQGATRNEAIITYEALTDTTVHYAWDFAYSGPRTFGFQRVHLSQDNSLFESLGNSGSQGGSFMGDNTLFLTGGSTYEFTVFFEPNVTGGIQTIDGLLSGSVTFDFDPAGTSVPEPASLVCFAGLLGFASVVCLRRRRRIEDNS